ncbi:MAG: hypothetical protein ACTSUV_04830 [Candidatus Ranarchaeia archaeon]
MGSKQKIGAYDHFCLVVIAQGQWADKDYEVVRDFLIQKRKKYTTDEFGFFLKLTHRKEIPIYSDCPICQPIYQWLTNLKGQNDGLIYQGHYFITPEDFPEMNELVHILLSNEKVKKLYILYLDSLGELKRTAINNMDMEDITNLIKTKKIKKTEISEILTNEEFKERIMYEINRETYY